MTNLENLNLEKIEKENSTSILPSLFTSIKVASGDDYILPNLPELHKQIQEVLNLDYYHPKYQIWRVFLYRYLYANCDPIATEKFAKDFIENDRMCYRIPQNKTSEAVASYVTRLRTTSKSIFA